MFIAVIYYSYIILFWGGEREKKKFVKWVFGYFGLVLVGIEDSFVWVVFFVFVRVFLIFYIILFRFVGYLFLNRGCYLDLVRWEFCDIYLCFFRVKWGYWVFGNVIFGIGDNNVI